MWGPCGDPRTQDTLCGDMKPLGNNSRPSREGTQDLGWSRGCQTKETFPVTQALFTLGTRPHTARARPLVPGRAAAPGQSSVPQDGGLPGLRLWEPPSLQVSEQGTWGSGGQADL